MQKSLGYIGTELGFKPRWMSIIYSRCRSVMNKKKQLLSVSQKCTQHGMRDVYIYAMIECVHWGLLEENRTDSMKITYECSISHIYDICWSDL